MESLRIKQTGGEIVGRIKSNLFWLSLSEFLTRGSNVFIAAYLAHILSLGGFGSYAVIFALANYLWIVARMGTDIHGSNIVSKIFQKPSREEATFVYSILSARMVVVFIISIGVISTAFVVSSSHIIIVGYAISTLFLLGNAIDPQWYFRGKEKVKIAFTVNLIVFIAKITCIIMLVHSDKDVNLALFIQGAFCVVNSALLILVMVFVLKLYPVITFSILEALRNFGKAVPVGLANILSGIVQIGPLVILGWYLGEGNIKVGIFAASHRLTMIVISLASLLALTYFPILSSTKAHLEKSSISKGFEQLVKNYVRLTVVSGFILYLILWNHTPEIMKIMFGTNYLSDVWIMKTFSIIIPICFYRISIAHVLIIFGRYVQLAKANFFGLVLAALIWLLFFRTKPLIASIGAFFMGELFSFVITYVYTRKITKMINLENMDLFIILCFCALIFVFNYLEIYSVILTISQILILIFYSFKGNAAQISR